MTAGDQSDTAALRAEVERLRGRLAAAGLDEADGQDATSVYDELARTASALAMSEARYRAILESATDFAIVATGLDGVITTWNEGARRIMGWSEEEARGRTAHLFFTPEDVEAGRPEYEMTLARDEGRATDERWHQRKDGSRFWANGLMMPLRTDGGPIQGFLKILRDRTAEREAQERQSRSEERLRLALEASVMVGIWDWDLRDDVIYSDGNFARIYGVDAASAARGAPLSEYMKSFCPEDLPGFEAALARTLHEGAPFSHEYRIVQPDGSVRWVLARGSIVRDETGKPVRFPGATVEITDRKLAEDRQAALVELSDRFRDLDDTAEMAFVAADILGRTLRLSRSGYGSVDASGDLVEIERDWTSPGIASISGRHRFADFGTFIADLRAGEMVVIDDVMRDPRTVGEAERFGALDIRALLNAPVIESGELVAVLFLHDRQPRHWSSDKLAFIREVAQRTRDGVERRRAEEQQRLLMGELQHRVKNTLAMVQAIASQTFRATESSAARDAFMHRVIALAQANDVLTRAGWAAAPIGDIVKGATIPHCAGPERFTMTGPAVDIAARAALSLTLALHELCTNASKYGALSTDSGHVTIDWDVESDAVFRLRWAEQGGPPVKIPSETGFGTRLIQRSLGPSLGGEIRTDYDQDGVKFTFEVPLSVVQERAGLI